MSSWVSKLVAATFISALALIGSAKAADVGFLYKYCKPYADRAFKAEKPGDLLCIMYFTGVSDTAGQLCHDKNNKGLRDAIEADGNIMALAGTDLFLKTFSSDSFEENLDAVIQKFVNVAKDRPEDWNLKASGLILGTAREVKPCESGN